MAQLNIDTMKEQLFRWHERPRATNKKERLELNQRHGGPITVKGSKIVRNKRAMTLTNRKESKRYNVVYSKRVVQHDLDTLPFGHW